MVQYINISGNLQYLLGCGIITNMSHKRFLKLSQYLTAQTELDFELLDSYYSILSEKYTNLDQVLESVVATENVNQSSLEKHHNIKKDILLLWYSGSIDNVPVSLKAYEKSLVWQLIYATPQGVSQSFGCWQHNPEEQ